MTITTTAQPKTTRISRPTSSLPVRMALAIALVAMQSPPVRANDAVAQELADCQDEAKPAEQRVKICTALIDVSGVDSALKAEALLNRGMARQDGDDAAAALGDYTEAIALNPEYPALYVQRAYVYQEMDEVALAIKDMTRAIELAPDDADSFATRGELYAAAGDAVLAEADYRKALGLEADHEQARDGLKALKK